ncbi:hypothetical protein GYH30_015842 [Glycine max]|uniref:ATP-dependent DNA helicase n=1 Tax=Glycine max TaxID=3847 RepID=K7KWH6_SOYBN|nr:hypothetical protein GYH30_015842 [Glycine max]
MENHRFTSKFGPAKARSNIKRIRQQKVHLNVQDSVHASVNPTSSHIEDDYNQPKTPSHSVHATADRASHDAEDHCNYGLISNVIIQEYFDLGDQIIQCRHCNAKMWYNENISKHSNTLSPRFSLCCGDEKIELPLLQNPPKFLQQVLFEQNTAHAKNYQQNIRTYNMIHYNEIEAHIVSNLQKMLDENNAHAKSFRMAKDRLTDTQVHNVRLKLIVGQEKDGRTYNVPSVPEVAALIAGDIDANSNRDIIVETQNGQLQRVHELHCSYLALQYPLLFPYGEDGYRPDILHCDTLSGEKRKRNRLTMREWFAYRLQCRPNEGQTLLHSRKVFQQFVAEGYTMIESERLSYSSEAGNTEGLGQDKRIILPSTFVGSPRYMDRLYFDGIAICSHVGFPNLFITFTCNPNWPEIHKLLTPLNLTPIDRPEIISRIFKLKYEQMLSYITKNHLLGKVVGYMYTVEFQKRGLPHVHLLLFLHANNKYPSPNDIDHIISTEIPSQKDDPELYKLVQNHMVHGPCGILRPASPCMKEGKCSRFYPKKFQATTIIDGDGYPVYRRRNTGRTITKNGIIIDNRSHINIEWCNQSPAIKYLLKYINKGYDRVTVVMVHDDNETVPHANTPNDEMKEYMDCRYISPCESTWRIFGFPIHGRKPSVERLQFHLPGQHSVLCQDHDDIDDLLSNPSISESKFIAWMNTNQVFLEGQKLTYFEFVTKFVYNQKQRCWQLRKKGYTIGRLQWVPPTTGELFYLRMMLTVCRGPISFEDIRKIDGVEYSTYREACFAMGLHIDDSNLMNLVLLEVEKLLKANQSSLKDYPSMPYPENANLLTHADNDLFLSELNFNNEELRSKFLNLFSQMTDQQAKIYNQIIQAVNKNEGGMFFLYGYGGTGKTFIWKTLAASLRADNKLVIMVASSGIASLLLPGGKTTHSKLKILVPIFEDSTCNIHQGTQLAELLNEASLVIWDEAPMAHKFCFEALDRSLRDVIKAKLSSDKIFGGKVMVFGGDFRQILPVIPREANTDATEKEETATFAEWILNIGDGIAGQQNDGYGSIEIPKDLLITEYDDPLYATVNSTFPNLSHHHSNHEYFQTRAILASTNETVQQVNDYILSLIPGDQMEYLSADYVGKSETLESSHFRSLTTEFLNSLTTSDLPNHNIKIKIGSPIMLLRNLDQTQGLCNDTRLIVTNSSYKIEIIESQAETSIALSLSEIMGTTTNDNNNNSNSTSKSDANDNKNNNTRVVLNVYDLTPLNNTFIG